MSEVNFGNVSGIEEQKVYVKRFGRKRVAVCRVDNSFYAFQDVCTHDGAPLFQGQLCGNIIECPRHGAKFDVKTGAVMAAPAIIPIPVYPLKVENGEIKIKLE